MSGEGGSQMGEPPGQIAQCNRGTRRCSYRKQHGWSSRPSAACAPSPMSRKLFVLRRIATARRQFLSDLAAVDRRACFHRFVCSHEPQRCLACRRKLDICVVLHRCDRSDGIQAVGSSADERHFAAQRRKLPGVGRTPAGSLISGCYRNGRSGRRCYRVGLCFRAGLALG
jgi:hypothetical protein